MAAYIRAADAVREAFNCAVIIVHHCGIDTSRPRGHTSLGGAVDAQLAVRRDPGDNVILEVEWMKDGPEGDVIASRLDAVEVGTDDDGHPITSCVVVPVDDSLVTTASKAPRLTKAAQTALRALVEAVANRCHSTGIGHIPTGVRVVTVDQWRDYAYRMGISTSSEDRAKQQAFKRRIRILDWRATRRLLGQSGVANEGVRDVSGKDTGGEGIGAMARSAQGHWAENRISKTAEVDWTYAQTLDPYWCGA